MTVNSFKYSLVIFLFSFCVNSCANPQSTDVFYRGLLAKSEQNIPEAVIFFEKALECSNIYIRKASADLLADIFFSGNGGEDFSSETALKIRKEASGWWAAAFEVFENTPDTEKILSLLLSYGHRDAIPEDVRSFILNECERKGIFFSEHELAAINGHSAVSRLRYGEAMMSFRVFQKGVFWPELIPSIFLTYPALINDLGRALQFTSAGTEGLNLLLQWEKNLTEQAPETARYSLLFFAARIARRHGLYSNAVSLFEQAFATAPDSEQTDACIWYILDITLRENPDLFIQKLEQTVSLWHNRRYYNDVLERFLQILCSAHDWKRIIRVFNIIQDSKAPVKAAYAWVIARAIEEGFLTDEEMVLAIITRSGEPSAYMQIAYNILHDDVSSLLYYRLLSSEILNLPFLDLPDTPYVMNEEEIPPALEFLLGFFEYGVSSHVLPFVSQIEHELTSDELRIVAQALENEGMYPQSIRLVSRYLNRENHVLNRNDMKLLFPLSSFSELVEEQASRTGINPETILALIRTESAFQSSVISHAGAVGLTQLMPDTAREMAGRIRRAGGPDYANSANGIDLNDPAQNIYIGVFYLDYLMERFDDKLLSFFAYNGGMNRVRRWRNASSLPADLFLETIAFHETRDYGRKIVSASAVYRELYYMDKNF